MFCRKEPFWRACSVNWRQSLGSWWVSPLKGELQRGQSWDRGATLFLFVQYQLSTTCSSSSCSICDTFSATRNRPPRRRPQLRRPRRWRCPARARTRSRSSSLPAGPVWAASSCANKASSHRRLGDPLPQTAGLPKGDFEAGIYAIGKKTFQNYSL